MHGCCNSSYRCASSYLLGTATHCKQAQLGVLEHRCQHQAVHVALVLDNASAKPLTSDASYTLFKYSVVVMLSKPATLFLQLSCTWLS